MIKKFIACLMLTAYCLLAQAQGEVEMADTMHSNGKIYVVIGVIAIIFVGIIVYLISIDKKVSSIEKKLNK